MINENTHIQEYTTEIEKIEKDFLQELKVLEDRIDKQYQQFSIGIYQITQQLLNLSSLFNWDKWSGVITLSVGIIGQVAKGYTGYIGAKAHNEALDKLLKVKMEIATTKISKMKDIKARTTKYRKKLEGLCNGEIINLKEENKEGHLKDLRKIALKRLNIYREALYIELVSTYILAEYEAWSSGEHTSKMNKPSLWEANAIIVNNCLKIENIKSLIKSCASDSLRLTTLLILADEGLYSYCDIKNGGEKSVLSKALCNRNKIVRKWMKVNKAPRKLFWQRWLYKIWTGMGGWPTLIALGCLIELYGVFWLFHDYLEWSLWIRWIVGIIVSLLVIVQIIIVMYISIENWEDGKCVRKRNFMDKIKSFAGYVPYIKPDFSKKSLFLSGVKGFFS